MSSIVSFHLDRNTSSIAKLKLIVDFRKDRHCLSVSSLNIPNGRNRRISQFSRRTSNKTPRPVRVYQPTYQLNPRVRFNEEKVQKILRKVVETELAEVEYDENTVPELCLNLAETLRNAVKDESYDRYRILAVVSIGQKRQQSVNVFHSFLWDAQRDSFATYNFENCHIFANVVVYGVYLE